MHPQSPDYSVQLNYLQTMMSLPWGVYLNSILRNAQSEGVVDKDVTPTMRDGRLVIPVAPALKRKIPR